MIFYAVRELARNAARHGRSPAGQPLSLVVTVRGGNELVIEVRDNGQRMGATPAELSSGQGLTMHAGMMAVVGGALSFARGEAGGTNAAIRLGAGQLT